MPETQEIPQIITTLQEQPAISSFTSEQSPNLGAPINPDQWQGEKSKARHREAVITHHRHALEQKFGLLPETHPLHIKLQQVINQTGSHFDRELPETTIILDPSVNAYTYYDHPEAIFFNAGLISELERFSQTKGRVSSLDELGFVAAHEEAHHDKEAKGAHQKELYCDTEGMLALAENGYNPQAAERVFEFLGWAGGSQISISHPAKDYRITRIRELLHTPDYFLPNTEKPPAPISPKMLADLEGQCLRSKKSLEIWNTEEVSNLVEQAKTESDLSFLLEEAERISDLVSAEIAKELWEKHPEKMASITIFYGALHDLDITKRYSEKQQPGTLLNPVRDDFRLNQSAGKNQKELPAEGETPLIDEALALIEKQAQEDYVVLKDSGEGYKLTPEAERLLGSLLKGEIENPLGLFTGENEELTNQFAQAGVELDKFFDRISQNLFETKQSPPNRRQKKHIVPTGIKRERFRYSYWWPSGVKEIAVEKKRQLKIQARKNILENASLPLGLALLRRIPHEEGTGPVFSWEKEVSHCFTNLIQENSGVSQETAQAVSGVLLDHLWWWRQPKKPQKENLPPAVQQELFTCLDGLRFYPARGEPEFSRETDISFKWRRQEAEASNALSLLYHQSIEGKNLSLLEHFQKIDQFGIEGFFDGVQVAESEFYNQLLNTVLTGKDATQLHQLLDFYEFDPELLGLVFVNPNFSKEERYSFFQEAWDKKLIGGRDIKDLLAAVEYVNTNGKEGNEYGLKASITDEETMWWYERLLPLSIIDSPEELIGEYDYGDIMIKFWELTKKRLADKPAPEVLTWGFAHGGLLAGFPEGEYRLSLKDQFGDELKRLSENERLALVRNIQQITEKQIENGRLGYDLQDSLSNLACEIVMGERLETSVELTEYGYRVRKKDIEVQFDESLSFDQNLDWIIKSLPRCTLRDMTIERLAKKYPPSKDDATKLASLLPHLTPIERPNQTPEGSVKDSQFGFEFQVTPDQDPFDLLTTVKIGGGLKSQVIQKIWLNQYQEFWGNRDVSLDDKLARLDDYIPENCKLKDVLFRHLLTDEWKSFEGLEGGQLKQQKEQMLTVIESRLEKILDPGSKVTVGYFGAKIQFELNPELTENFSKGLTTITKLMPEHSLRRDELLIEQMDNAWVIPQEMFQAIELLATNNFRTDVKSVAVNQALKEALSEGTAKADVKAKIQFLQWLLSPPEETQSLIKAREAGIIYDHHEGRIIKKFLGKELEETSIDELAAEVAKSKHRDLFDSYQKVVHYGLPEEFRSALSFWRKKHIARLRETVALMNPLERRQLLFDMFLREGGILRAEAKEDQQAAKEFFANFGRLMADKANFSEDEAQNQKVGEFFGTVISETLTRLPPETSFNIFNRLMDTFMELNLEKADANTALRAMFSAFGPVGVKLGQGLADQAGVLPEKYRLALAELRDEVPPLSKAYAFQILAANKKLDQIQSIGPLLGSASLKQVYLMRDTNGKEVVGKFWRPQSAKEAEAIFELLVEKPGIPEGARVRDREFELEVPPEELEEEVEKAAEKTSVEENLYQIITTKHPEFVGKIPLELFQKVKGIIDEELIPETEAARAREVRPRLGWRGIKVPKVLDVGEKFMLEELAQGKNFEEIEAQGDKAKTQKVAETTVREFLFQVFKDGKYHTDLHPGNSFSDEQLRTTFIDFGQMGWVAEAETRRSLFDFMVAFAGRDSRHLTNSISDLTQKTPPDLEQQIHQLGLEKIDKTDTESLKAALNKILGITLQAKPKEELVTFIKALIPIQSYLQHVPESRLKRIVAPFYIKRRLRV